MPRKHTVSTGPVDPSAIAESLGIVVQASQALEGSFSGCLPQGGASFGILYSTGIRNKGYQRFAVAHELGHFSLTDHHGVLFEKGALHRSESGFTSGVWYEREADLFGVELLIPEFLFHKHRREFPIGLDEVKGLAELFRTSLTATGIRYATLSTEPVAVVVSEGDRILYSALSKPFASRFWSGCAAGERCSACRWRASRRSLTPAGRSSPRSAASRRRIGGSRRLRGACGRGDWAWEVWEDANGAVRRPRVRG